MPTAMTSCASLDKAPKDIPPVTKRLQMETASSLVPTGFLGRVFLGGFPWGTKKWTKCQGWTLYTNLSMNYWKVAWMMGPYFEQSVVGSSSAMGSYSLTYSLDRFTRHGYLAFTSIYQVSGQTTMQLLVRVISHGYSTMDIQPLEIGFIAGLSRGEEPVHNPKHPKP